MKKKLWPFVVLGGLLGWVSLAGAANEESTVAPSVQQLISQLGDDQYVVRQRAEIQLLERGAEAFAELQAAGNHADLEISTRAKYLLNQISIDWVHPTDVPVVRSIMARFGELSLQGRLGKVAKLAELAHEQGFGALCRIARYESSGQIARFAALSILEKGILPKARTAAAIKALKAELGENQESPQSWVGTYVDQLQSPKQIDPRWLTLLDAEIELLSDKTSTTRKSLVATFLTSHLELCNQLSDAEAIAAGLERRIALGAHNNETMSARLVDAISWLTDREQWEALELFENRYEDSIKQEHLVLYHLALARVKQGRIEDSEAVALQALRLAEPEAEHRNLVADVLTELGRHDWAEQEWKSVIAREKVTEYQSLLARQSLAMHRLHDRLEHKEAADLLTESIDAINADSQIKQVYQEDKGRADSLKRFRSNREHMLACHEETQGNFERQRQHLEKANQLEGGNADILIAMFHLAKKEPGTKDVYRKKVRKRLAEAKQELEKNIRSISRLPAKQRQNPGYNAVLAQWHNHWAWLVSNTEGDFKKAVQHSKKSLALAPGSPSYLDTLGRCYYAAGELDNAIKVQREAIEKHPHMLVMQRQLKQFEDELRNRPDATD